MRPNNAGPRLTRWALILAGSLSGACSTSPTDAERESRAAPSGPTPGEAALTCPGAQLNRHILIDASRDGGVWWYPQGDTVDPEAPHQGQRLADYLRSRGYVVDELPRGRIVSDTLLATYAGVIRAGQYGTYTAGELRAYDWSLDCGMTVVLLGEFLHDGGHDKLAESMGINARGNLTGLVTTFAEHPITEGVEELAFIAGSSLGSATVSGVEVLGWLDTGEPVMGVVSHPKGRIFFLGDTNGLEEVPQPLVDNLIALGIRVNEPLAQIT